ncbi:Protein of unknown function [Bacillus mycoides]|nr:Protein of unknown function [Bacillus mycoides]
MSKVHTYLAFLCGNDLNESG